MNPRPLRIGHRTHSAVATRATSTGRGVRIPGGRTLLVLTALSASLPAVAQNQSLAFT
ncbi:MAG: hypothetical protein IT580_02230, partial [Verrucomicrobiales bacterium]|nr:hypothetical protein [Verrucomicrobiales bacterium]